MEVIKLQVAKKGQAVLLVAFCLVYLVWHRTYSSWQYYKILNILFYLCSVFEHLFSFHSTFFWYEWIWYVVNSKRLICVSLHMSDSWLWYPKQTIFYYLNYVLLIFYNILIVSCCFLLIGHNYWNDLKLIIKNIILCLRCFLRIWLYFFYWIIEMNVNFQ